MIKNQNNENTSDQYFKLDLVSKLKVDPTFFHHSACCAVQNAF
ncbi:hypothetical protein BXY58_0733 [Epilithonimonas arachidiradicis]|uniref:Uncharacterized protein n=1 Tax=Epilithonimonas arachidiradicis TaxID=1617282 RepID=A0A420DE09_9FLAO|nr:hypothetical protein BXY58_0733 [Epilithonimonas arachidiradicis]